MTTVEPSVRVTIDRPGFTEEQKTKINQACVDRLQCHFDKAQEVFESIMNEQTSEFAKLWLQSQVFKTQY